MLTKLLTAVLIFEGPRVFAQKFEEAVTEKELPHAHRRIGGPIIGLFMKSELEAAERALHGDGEKPRGLLARGMRRATLANEGVGGWIKGGCARCRCPIKEGEGCPRCHPKNSN